MLLAVNIGRSCGAHSRGRSRYAIRRLRFTNFCVLLVLTRNASVQKSEVWSPTLYIHENVGISSVFYDQREKTAPGYAWIGPSPKTSKRLQRFWRAGGGAGERGGLPRRP